MPNPPPPRIECEQHHTTLHVADLSAAIEFYTARLGFLHAFSWGEPASMAGVNLGKVQIFLEQGTPAPEGCSVYFVVDDADALHRYHRATGVRIIDPPADRAWHLREYTVRDLDGYALTFGHRLPQAEPECE